MLANNKSLENFRVEAMIIVIYLKKILPIISKKNILKKTLSLKKIGYWLFNYFWIFNIY